MMNPGLRRDISPCHSGLSGNALRLGRRKRSTKMKKLFKMVFSLSIVLAVSLPAMADDDGNVLDQIKGKRYSFYTNVPGEAHHSNGCQQVADEFSPDGSLNVTTVSQIWNVSFFVVLGDSDCVASHFDPAKVYVCDSGAMSFPFPFFDLVGGSAVEVRPLGISLHPDHIAQENHNAPTVPIPEAPLVAARGTSFVSGVQAEIVLWEDENCVDPTF